MATYRIVADDLLVGPGATMTGRIRVRVSHPQPSSVASRTVEMTYADLVAACATAAREDDAEGQRIYETLRLQARDRALDAMQFRPRNSYERAWDEPDRHNWFRDEAWAVLTYEATERDKHFRRRPPTEGERAGARYALALLDGMG